jgi:hypothetical protein
MAGSNLRFLGIIVFILAIPASGLAAPSSGSPSSGTDRDPDSGRQPKIEEMKTLGVDRQLASFAGMVLDVNDRPIGGVQVKLFIDGEVAGRAVSESNGYYDLRAAYDPSDDVTVLLWFVAPDRALMPKELVIQESKSSRANGLISKCVPRASLSPGRQFRIYLFDVESRNKELAESGCIP